MNPRLLLFLSCCLLLAACFSKDSVESPAEKWQKDKLQDYPIPYVQARDSVLLYHPDEAELLYGKSVTQFGDRELQAGIANLSKAAKLAPKKYLNYLGYIKLYYLLDYESAAEDFEACLKMGVKEDFTVAGNTTQRLGLARLKLEQYEQAIKQFTASKDASYSYVYRGIAKHRMGDLQGALADFDLELKSFEKCPEAYYQKAQVLLAIGKKKEACKAVQKALLYKDYAWGNPRRAYIEQLYQDDVEVLFDLACR